MRVGYLRDETRGEEVRQRGVVLRNPNELSRATRAQHYGARGGFNGNTDGQLTDVQILAASRQVAEYELVGKVAWRRDARGVPVSYIELISQLQDKGAQTG